MSAPTPSPALLATTKKFEAPKKTSSTPSSPKMDETPTAVIKKKPFVPKPHLTHRLSDNEALRNLREKLTKSSTKSKKTPRSNRPSAPAK